MFSSDAFHPLRRHQTQFIFTLMLLTMLLTRDAYALTRDAGKFKFKDDILNVFRVYNLADLI